jgi:nucleotide-binding universal stress UspA family protein
VPSEQVQGPSTWRTPKRATSTWLPTNPAVLVPLIGSGQSLAALSVARGLAQLLQGTIHLMYAAEGPVSPQKMLAAVGLTPRQARDTVLDPVVGPPAANIGRLAREWRRVIVVLSMRHDPTDARHVLGPVAEEVVQQVSCPVVLVPPGMRGKAWAIQRILLPYDGSPTAAGAIGPAAELASRAEAELVVLHVGAITGDRPVEPGTLTGPRYVDQQQYEWSAWTEEFMARVRVLGKLPTTLQLRLAVETGDPGEAIVRSARKQHADLITLAWRGVLANGRAATLKCVLATAPCPVLIVRVGQSDAPTTRASKTIE